MFVTCLANHPQNDPIAYQNRHKTSDKYLELAYFVFTAHK